MDAIGAALGGINTATQLLNTSARRISEEGVNVEAIVNSKVAETAVTANLISAKTALEVQGSALDILA